MKQRFNCGSKTLLWHGFAWVGLRHSSLLWLITSTSSQWRASPPTHHPNVKMLIILWPVFEPCKCVTCVSVVAFKTFEDPLQGGRVWLKDPDAVWKPAEVFLHSVLLHSVCLWSKSTFSKSKVVTAYNGKSVEVEDEGGDRQTIAVKDEQADLPPLR